MPIIVSNCDYSWCRTIWRERTCFCDPPCSAIWPFTSIRSQLARFLMVLVSEIQRQNSKRWSLLPQGPPERQWNSLSQGSWSTSAQSIHFEEVMIIRVWKEETNLMDPHWWWQSHSCGVLGTLVISQFPWFAQGNTRYCGMDGHHT